MEENIESTELVAEEIKVALDVTKIVNELNEEQVNSLCKENDITISDIEELAKNSYEFSDLEKKIKPLKEKVKKMMLGACAKKAVFGKTSINITFQDRGKMDEDALVALLQEKDLDEYIIQIPKPDVSRLQELLINGLITDTDLQSCVVPNWIPVVKFPTRKKTTTTTSTAPKETVADRVKATVNKKGAF